MLDIRVIRRDPEQVKAACRGRGVDCGGAIDELLVLDGRRRALLARGGELRAQRRRMELRFPALQREGASVVPLKVELRLLAQKLAGLEEELEELEERRGALLLQIPNLPREELPAQETGRELARWGEPAAFPYPPKRARQLADALGILAPAGEDGAPAPCGMGARLLRALENAWLDALSAGGLTELAPFWERDGARSDAELLLRPCRDAVLPARLLPLGFCAALARPIPEGGMQRDVGAVSVVAPGQGGEALRRLTEHLAGLLRGLGLPHRVISPAAPELPFFAAEARRVEVWMPSVGRYEPVSVLSDCGDFLARRIACRCKQEEAQRPRPAETACATVGLIPLAAAILENGQDGGGSVAVPEALRPAMGAARIAR